jgi:hypothetical protein
VVDRICPGCGKPIGDDDTVLRQNATDPYWHITCHDLDHRRRLMEPKMNEMDPAAWARWSTASGAKPFDVKLERAIKERCFPDTTIDYMITPKCFVLRVPVEALANLTPDAQTRMLNMLNTWVIEHKPPRCRDEKIVSP